MKEDFASITYPHYKLSATEELQAALEYLGFRSTRPEVKKGCHGGFFYLFKDQAKKMLELCKDIYVLSTPQRKYFITPNKLQIPESNISKFDFSIN